MCTAIGLNPGYFGRNLDIDRNHGEQVVILPRKMPLIFRHKGMLPTHYAMIGMAAVEKDTPLYFDAANEWGLGMAGLHFPENAHYAPPCAGKDNIASFELITWVLGQCRSVEEAKALLAKINLTDTAFSKALPPSPLHWMLTDGASSIVIEPRKEGLQLYDNPVGVLTNNPPFQQQMENWLKYSQLRNDNKAVVYPKRLPYSLRCSGLGAVGLPGDVSSPSRFVRAAFLRRYAVCEADELAVIGQLFHLLSAVEMIKGCCITEEGTADATAYACGIHLASGRYYYKTYENHRLSVVDLRNCDLEGEQLSCYPLQVKQDIFLQN